MILIEKSTERFRKILHDFSHIENISEVVIADVLPDTLSGVEYDEIEVVSMGQDSPIYDSQEEKVVELDSIAYIKDPEQYKADKIEEYSRLAFQIRQGFLPDYKLVNANGGRYDETITANIWATIEAFRVEFYRVKAIIDGATDQATIKSIAENYPTEIIIA